MVAIIVVIELALFKISFASKLVSNRQLYNYFYPPIDLPTELGQGNYKAALNRLITMSYSWNNIDSRYDNNKIRWKKKTEQAWKTLTFPNGMYDYKRINTFIQQHTGKVDPSNITFSLYISICRFIGL